MVPSGNSSLLFRHLYNCFGSTIFLPTCSVTMHGGNVVPLDIYPQRSHAIPDRNIETEEEPQCANVQTLQASMNELKSILNSSELSVLVGLVQKHRCCAGSGHGVRGDKHRLEGVWKSHHNDMVFIHTVRGKPEYLFGTKLVSRHNVPAEKVSFWFRSGGGAFKDILKSKIQTAGPRYTNRKYFTSFY